MTTERFFKLEDLPPDTRIRNNIFPSLLFPASAPIRAGDLQMKVLSVNDKRNTVTFELVGLYLKPLEEGGNGQEPIQENPPPIILTPNKRIIT